MSWKPIDTAPKDGTHILLRLTDCDNPKPIVIEGWWDENTYYHVDKWSVVTLAVHGCGCCGYNDHKPDGWMELPA